MPRPQPPPDDEPGSITRRAPFADNPVVGERGQRAQQRILDAALQVFGEVGYHRCGVKRITELAGCSRASFYQYFSSKEDLFRHLAGQVARALRASTEEITQLTPDQAGWDELRAWLDRYSAVYDAYEPVFVTFHVAAAADEAVAAGSNRIKDHQEAALRSKVVGAAVDGAEVAGIVRTILDTVSRGNRICELIEHGHPDSPLHRHRFNEALADVFHRALFGVLPDVNSRRSARPAEAALADERDRQPRRPLPDGGADVGPIGRQTRSALLEAGHQVFVDRGYYGTRVDDIASAAGVSHGVFYRYFENKDHLFRLLAARAGERLNVAFDAVDEVDPDAPGAPEALRAWLQRYAAAYAEEAAIIRVWMDAIMRDAELGSASVDAISTGRSQLLRLLRDRGFGDVEAEAVVLLVLLEAMVAGGPEQRRVDRVAGVIERAVVCVPRSDGPARGGRRRLRLAR